MSEAEAEDGNIVVLPGVERRDLAGVVVPSADVLERAIELGVTDCVIVGRHRDGSLYVAGETNDMDRAAGILMRGLIFISSGLFGSD